MDVHQDAIAGAYVAQDHGAEGLDRGALGTRPCDLDQLIRTRTSNAPHFIFVPAASPCGSWLSRDLTQNGDACWVAAPSLRPKKAGDRVNTDRRDAVPRARLARAGDLTAVDVPLVDDEARRDRTRARDEALSARQDATCRLTTVWLRQDSRDGGRANGARPPPLVRRGALAPTGAAPRLSSIGPCGSCADRTPPASRTGTARSRARLACAPGVEARQAWRGVPCTVAVTLGSIMGELTRVDHPRARMNCLGLMPSAYASGEPRRPGSITIAGTTQARRALVEGAWASRDPAQVSRPLPRRLEPHPNSIQDISWKAQVRRCTRDRRLVSRGHHAHGVTVASARELAGFMGAIAREVPGTPSDHTRARIPPLTEKVPHVHRQRHRPGVGSPSAA